MKTEIGSAVRRFAEITGKHPADIIADPVVVRLLADKASWQLAGLSKESWANLEKQAHPRDEDRLRSRLSGVAETSGASR